MTIMLKTKGASALDKIPYPEDTSSGGAYSGEYMLPSAFRSVGSIILSYRPLAWSTGSEQPAPTFDAAELEREFQELARKWKHEVGHLSVSSQIAAHPAYQSIIDMGDQALPLILKDLKAEPDHWFEALVAISDETPHIPEHHKGDLIAVSKAWVEWGKMKRYIE